MRKVAVPGLVCFCLCCSLPAKSQYYFYNSRYYDAPVTVEAGLAAGAMNCLTDLGGKHESGRPFIGDLSWRDTHICGGFFAGVNYNNMIGLRLGLAWGSVSASDSLQRRVSPENGRSIRNLSFRSDIREASLLVECYPLTWFAADNFSCMPYLLGGIGSFSFAPEALWNGAWVNLSSLHTEGQGFSEYPQRLPYKLTQFNLPLGAGIKWELGPCASLRCEVVCRHLFTDYLDDASTTYVSPDLFDRYLPPRQARIARLVADRRPAIHRNPARPNDIRGNKTRNDTYFSVCIKASVVLGRKRIR